LHSLPSAGFRDLDNAAEVCLDGVERRRTEYGRAGLPVGLCLVEAKPVPGSVIAVSFVVQAKPVRTGATAETLQFVPVDGRRRTCAPVWICVVAHRRLLLLMRGAAARGFNSLSCRQVVFVL
jgi:hypothetical protein